MCTLNIEQTKNMILYVADKIIESKPYLTEVDSKIGDGDHGIGMSLGFTKAKEALLTKDLTTVNQVFKTTGMTMINSMGGASGIIFGTMFSGGVKELEPSMTIDLDIFTQIFEKSLQAIKDRGKAQVGDKTMVDALQPAVEALRKSCDDSKSFSEALKSAEDAAEQGLEKTKAYVAKFGRAKSLQDRAIGYQDAGATSVYIIMKSMREWFDNNSN